MRGRKFFSWGLALCLLIVFALPAMAADPQTRLQDLKGIRPARHRYLFSAIGGALLGGGIGAIIGSGNDITKGIMVGGGGLSALYLHSHRHDTLAGWRPWAYMASYTVFGGGVGWTVCGCHSGLGGGLLIGAGASAIKASWNPGHSTATATSEPTPPPEPKRRRRTEPAQPAPPPPQQFHQPLQQQLLPEAPQPQR